MSTEALLKQVLNRLSAIEAKIGVEGGSAASDGGDLPAQVEAFDDYMASTMPPFLDACKKLGGSCEKRGNLLNEAWLEMRSYIMMASASKAPADSEVMGLLAPVIPKMKAVSAPPERDAFERHVKALSEGVSAMNWLCVKPAPKDIVETALDGFQFIANKIRVEFKTSDENQIAFCDTGKKLFEGLVEYVKTHHKVGLKWNPQGKAAKDYDGAAAPAAKPPQAPPAAAPAAAAAKPAGNADLFASLNKGLDVTGALKKVTKDMKSSNQPPAAPAVAKAPVAPRVNSNKPKGPAKCELAPGGKWIVENQDGPCTVTIESPKQFVYIYGCIGADITISGKCKMITMDTCKKTKLHFEDVMASCEVVNSQRCHLDISKLCPSLALDKVDGCTVFLAESAKESVELSCAKISEINLQWNDSEGELVEKPVPEQYVHRVKNNAITVDVSDLYSC